MNDKPFNWPRVRELPEAEQQPFLDFLAHQTRPWIDGEPESEQDGYYQSDYDRFKGFKPNGFWD